MSAPEMGRVVLVTKTLVREVDDDGVVGWTPTTSRYRPRSGWVTGHIKELSRPNVVDIKRRMQA